jgi:hypothetical protein
MALRSPAHPALRPSLFARKKIPIDCAIVCSKNEADFNWRLFDLPLSSKTTLPELHAAALGWDWAKRQKGLL